MASPEDLRTSFSLSLPPIGAVGRVLPCRPDGPIPYFASAAERNGGPDGVAAAERLLRGFLEVFPPAAEGLRLTVLDAPDPSPYLLLLTNLAEEGLLSGAHLLALRHPRKVGTDLASTPRRRSASPASGAADGARRFTFEIADVAEHRMLPPESHCARYGRGRPDRGCRGGCASRAAAAAPGRSPKAALPHRRPPSRAGGRPGRPICLLLPGSAADRHTLAANDRDATGRGARERLRDASRHAHWFVLADRRVDRDLDLDLLRIYTGSEGDRDVAAFARYPDPFRRALREVASTTTSRSMTTSWTPTRRPRAVARRRGSLAADRFDGAVNHNAVKGVLGTLIASRGGAARHRRGTSAW